MLIVAQPRARAADMMGGSDVMPIPLIALLVQLLAATALPASEPFIDKTPVFRAGELGYELYRIPGIVVTARGTVLAYAEARKRAGGDWGPIDIVLRRSTDGGRTFSPTRVIAAVPGPHSKNPVAMAQNLAKEGEITYNNPIMIASREAGVVHLLFCLEYMRAFYARSTDDGLTFSPPREITAAFDAFRPAYDWRVLAIGPGHGIELRNGRLLAPVWISTGTGGHAHRPSVAATIVSDDGGATWKAGDIGLPNTDEWINPSETAAVELADGRVLLNARTESRAHRRLITISPDGATRWTTPRFDPALVEPICMGALVRHSLAADGGRNRILFANPDNLERATGEATPGRGRDRKLVTVQLSYDEGGTWPLKRVVEPGYSGYSDLAVLPNGEILLLYERSAEGARQFSPVELTLARFNLAWLGESPPAP
jgi:sialidase-1